MLSAREGEVLQLIAQGANDHEVGYALFISPNTVGHHVLSLFRKIRVRNRIQAALWYHDLPIRFGRSR